MLSLMICSCSSLPKGVPQKDADSDWIGILRFTRLLGYRGDMRGALRRVFVAVLTLAFLGGMLERSALGLTSADPCPLSGHTHTMAHQPLHVGHEHEHHATDKQQEPSKDQAIKCFCYGLAGFNIFPAGPVSDIGLQITPVSFSVFLKTYTGRSVILDPGIPKRIA